MFNCLWYILIAFLSAKSREPNEFLLFHTKLEENQSLSLICSADVGSPRGYIQIWKYLENFKPELIYTSSSTTNNTGSCTETINITFTVTRDDNGAFFRCSSQNSLTRGQEASRKSPKITVICRYTLFDT